MRLPFLLFTLLFCISHAVENIAEDIEDFIAKFHQLNATSDFLESLDERRIFNETSELFDLGRPIAKWLSTYNRNDEKDVKAISELRKTFGEEADKMVTHYDYDDSSFEPHILGAYASEITHKLLMSFDMTKHFLGDTSYAEKLANKANPLAVLDLIDQLLRNNCTMPSKDGIRNLIRVKKAIHRIEASLHKDVKDSDWERFKNLHLYPVVMKASDEEVDQLIAKLKEAYHTKSLEIIFAIVEEWKPPHELTTYFVKCLLESSNEMAEFKQNEYQNRIRVLYLEMMRIAVLHWASVASKVFDETSYRLETATMARKISRTSGYIVQWTRQMQNVTFPEIGIEAVKEKLGDSLIPLSALNETAKTIKKIFTDRGSPKFKYDVLVVPTSEMGVSWSVGTVFKENYANITNFNGLDIHIFRVQNGLHAFDRLVNAKKWMKRSKKALVKELKLGAIRSAHDSLAYLQNDGTIGPVYKEDRYRSVILLKRKDSKAFFFPIGFAGSQYDVIGAKKTVFSIDEKETIYSVKAFFLL